MNRYAVDQHMAILVDGCDYDGQTTSSVKPKGSSAWVMLMRRIITLGIITWRCSRMDSNEMGRPHLWIPMEQADR